MNNILDSKYKQFKIDFKTVSMYSNIEDYNEITTMINFIKDKIIEKQKFVHEDDDNTNEVLEDVINSLIDATLRLEDLKFYDGDGNRLG